MSPTDDEVLQTLQEYVNARADAGVVLAQSVQAMTIAGGVVEVLFDPQQAGLSAAAFDGIHSFDTPARLVADAFSAESGVGALLGPAVTRVQATLVDGTDLGSVDIGPQV